MPLKNHFYYDEENCEFIPIEYSRTEQVVYNLSIWILSGVVLSSLGIILLSTYIGTPAELALQAENQVLYEQLRSTESSLSRIDQQLEDIAANDNEVYRSILGMDDISYDEREAGIGGANSYPEFDTYSESTSEILKWASSRVDNLERRISIQKLSFEELKAAYNQNKVQLDHLPAIKPASGVIISGYGMRDHPILMYERMHNGMDFRADVGNSVFSTANGTVRYAGLKGNLGRIVIVDHGYGYETLYAHLSSIPKGIRNGTEVKRGQLIAYSGNTGLTQGPHLHYEIYLNGNSVDPINYLFADISPEEFLMYQEISQTNKKSMD